MARVIIDNDLKAAVKKKFKGRAVKIFRLMQELENAPKKGKHLTSIAGIAIKEIKYEGFRFYFIVDAKAIKFLPLQELVDLLIKFVRMSDKKEQQKTIEEIKTWLQSLDKT